MGFGFDVAGGWCGGATGNSAGGGSAFGGPGDL